MLYDFVGFDEIGCRFILGRVSFGELLVAVPQPVHHAAEHDDRRGDKRECETAEVFPGAAAGFDKGVFQFIEVRVVECLLDLFPVVSRAAG